MRNGIIGSAVPAVDMAVLGADELGQMHATKAAEQPKAVSKKSRNVPSGYFWGCQIHTNQILYKVFPAVALPD